jgi:hypothetical protein
LILANKTIKIRDFGRLAGWLLECEIWIVILPVFVVTLYWEIQVKTAKAFIVNKSTQKDMSITTDSSS